jgi:multiple sugar transport system substrate-binding protein
MGREVTSFRPIASRWKGDAVMIADSPHQTGARTDLSTTRRHFLQISLGATTGLAALLSGRTPPAVHAQTREISLLSWSHFVPASDKKLAEQAQRFTKETGIKMTVDHIANPQLPIKLAAEVQTQSGHDLIDLRMHLPIYYENQLVEITDIVVPLSEKNGGMYSFCEDASLVKGQWRAMPWYHLSFPGSYNKQHFDQVGEAAPDTWDDLLRAGKKLKAKGHPIGIAISQTFDSISTLSGVMWCYGSKAVEADGKTIVINSKETEAAIEYVKQLYNEAMEPEVLSWDDAGNNRHLVSGKGAWIHNPHSHYLTAREKKMPVAEQIYFHLSPQGPAGRHTPTVVRNLGIWKFSKNINAAKEFIKFHFSTETYSEFVMAGESFNAPVYQSMEDHPAWKIDPKYEPIKESGKYGHLYGWPAPGDEKSQQVTNSFIIPNMFAKTVTGTSTKDAMLWAEAEVRRIYQG